MRASPALGALMAILGLVAVALALIATGVAPVDAQGRGRFLPGHGEVWRVRVADVVTIYTPVFRVFWTDALVAMLLAAAGGAACVTAALLRTLGTARSRAVWPFHALVGAAAVFLALDETFSLHETLGYAVENTVGRPPLVHEPDDAILALYAALALACAWRFRAVALEPGLPRRLVAAGLVLTLGLVAVDLLGLPGEEYVEVAQAAFALAGYLALARHHLARELGSRAEVGEVRPSAA